MSLRSCLIALLTVALMALAARAAEFQVIDAAEFARILGPSAHLEKLATGFKFVEGPTWVGGADGYLIFSDIPNNIIRKWSPAGGLSTFRSPSNSTNGNTTDRKGRVISAEHTGRRLALTAADGTVSTLVDRFDGKAFNSPNDVVVKSDGTVWFTDPDYGLPAGAKREIPGNYIYRLEPTTGRITAVAKDFDKPNGLCFSPDEKNLYIADSGKPHDLRVFDVRDDGTLAGGRVFCTIDVDVPDGIRCDADGRIWSSAGDGVQIFGADGRRIGRILVPESPANLCFGGPVGRTLFITARTSLYAIRTNVKGAR